MFYQDPPQLPNLFDADHHLQQELQRRLSPELLQTWLPRFKALGQAAGAEVKEWADAAEATPPWLQPFDAWGRRVDRIHCAAAWDRLKEYSVQQRIVSSGYAEELGASARTIQAVLIYLFSSSSATYTCPLAMTDAAARVLIESAPNSLRERLLPCLLATDSETFITSGQWMTERTGGSDVSQSETSARFVKQEGDCEIYELSGVKWFTSATTAEMALALARVEDDRHLTLFCAEWERDEHGCPRGIEVLRLKDKLGTRAVPTAELRLNGLRAVRLGERGRGVPTVSTMLNITRYYNAVASASGMARGTRLAVDYAQRRRAFGKLLCEHPLHSRTLQSLEAESAAALSLCLELAELLGRAEADDEAPTLRAIVPIAKLLLGKAAVAHASEVLECFGGVGYIEDSGLPRLLRDAQVLPIWEGTTNVLSLDLLRAESKSGALSALVDELREQLPSQLTAKLRGVSRSERDARRQALHYGRLLQAALLHRSGSELLDVFVEDHFS